MVENYIMSRYTDMKTLHMHTVKT